jgi:hypothetical protein
MRLAFEPTDLTSTGESRFCGAGSFTIFAALFKKRIQNYKYKIRYENEHLCRTRKEITINYKFKKADTTNITKSRKIA